MLLVLTGSFSITLGMLGNFVCADFLSKLTFPKNSFRTTIRLKVSNSLNPDQDRNFVGPDLNPNCLQRLSADDKSQLARRESRCFQ